MADPIPAIVTAGDSRAAKAVYGESKVYLEVAGRSMVARVVCALQRVPEISEVWVVGNAERLEAVFSREDVQDELVKPLYVVPQFENLLANCWETYRRMLPDAGPAGRDPETEAERDLAILFISGDLPFATAEEISDFIQRSIAANCDYALGLTAEEALLGFAPTVPGERGIELAHYNTREGRLRQNNLHFARPARLGARQYIEDMYEHRHQREVGNMLALAWRLLMSERGGISVLFFYLLVHLAGFADRSGFRRVADRIRDMIALDRIERVVGKLLKTRFRFITTSFGGCALDVDTEEEYDVVRDRFEEWSKVQNARAAEIHGPMPPLPERALQQSTEGSLVQRIAVSTGDGT